MGTCRRSWGNVHQLLRGPQGTGKGTVCRDRLVAGHVDLPQINSARNWEAPPAEPWRTHRQGGKECGRGADTRRGEDSGRYCKRMRPRHDLTQKVCMGDWVNWEKKISCRRADPCKVPTSGSIPELPRSALRGRVAR